MYYQLIEDFGEQTGVPVILNTSLNVNGEPIIDGRCHSLFREHQGGLPRNQRPDVRCQLPVSVR